MRRWKKTRAVGAVQLGPVGLGIGVFCRRGCGSALETSPVRVLAFVATAWDASKTGYYKRIVFDPCRLVTHAHVGRPADPDEVSDDL